MKKGLVILGLILIIVGFLPIILQMIGFGVYAAYFYLGFYTLAFAGFNFSELMLILIIVGLLLLIIGAVA
ncbi:MAG: hypothetical protein ACFE89_12305 [Candidatus Hodarchaeota archaeon]